MIYSFINNIVTILTTYFQNLINLLSSFLGGLIISLIGAILIIILVKFFLTKGGL